MKERDSTNTGWACKRLGNEETVRDDRLQSRRWTRYTGGAGAPTPAMVSKRLHQRHTNNLSHDALSARLLLLVWCLCCVQKSDYVLTAANGGLPETLSSLSHMMSRVYDAATCMSRGGSQCHMGDFIGGNVTDVIEHCSVVCGTLWWREATSVTCLWDFGPLYPRHQLGKWQVALSPNVRSRGGGEREWQAT